MSVILIKSSSGSGVYEVDPENKTCTCPGIQKKGHCKHLDSLGVFASKTWYPPKVPSYSQAMSAVVKSIRLRDFEEATFWTLWVHHQPQAGGAFRLARRLLIGSAEDGHSIEVMERTSSKFSGLCKTDVDPVYLVAEVVRICHIDNWWNPSTNGPDYIRKGMIADRMVARGEGGKFSKDSMYLFDGAIDNQDKVGALTALMALCDNMDRTQLAQELAKKVGQMPTTKASAAAERLINIHLDHAGALKGDNNFLCQAVWWLTGGVSPVADTIKPVLLVEVQSLMARAYAKMNGPYSIGGWCCDGIHCGGNDRRFAGMWSDMTAVCNAYKYYGKLDHNDAWKPEFYSREGLAIV